MPLLTSADFTDLISAQLLINLTEGTATPDEDVIDKVSAAAWDEMWATAMAAAKAEGYTPIALPIAVPATGPFRDLLRKVTRYGLYSRRPELLATPEGEMIRLEKSDALKLVAALGKSGLAFDGLVTVDTTEPAVGISFYSNDVVYSKTNYRGC